MASFEMSNTFVKELGYLLPRLTPKEKEEFISAINEIAAAKTPIDFKQFALSTSTSTMMVQASSRFMIHYKQKKDGVIFLNVWDTK